VFQDVLKRWLQAKGYQVKHIMNITDVDEKTIERSARKKISLKSLSKKYEKAFFEDLNCLNILRASYYPRVSDNISEIVEMVKGLMERGHAIEDEDGSIYYDINSFSAYGNLSGNKPKRRIRARMPREDYKEPKNFLLWKKCETDHGIECYPSALGKGLPGWHIECAGLVGKYLGETIDIHSGGVDLIFPHHENEIAESEGYTGKTFSRYWVHVEHMLVYGKKMSKSMGNFFTLKQIIKKGFDPRAVRLLYLKTHYREKLDFDFAKLKKAEREIKIVEKIHGAIKNLKHLGSGHYEKETVTFNADFKALLDEDMQTDKAWKLFLNFMKNTNRLIKETGVSKSGAKAIIREIEWVDSIFGLLGEWKLTQWK
jgi:cysteinyl-tRNA synthetase